MYPMSATEDSRLPTFAVFPDILKWFVLLLFPGDDGYEDIADYVYDYP
jgi:hypothetical protein